MVEVLQRLMLEVTASRLIFLTGMLHFCQIPAMIMAPRMLGWKEDLAKLTTINRAIVLVMGGGIILTVTGLGIVVVLCTEDLVRGTRMGAALACFLGVFWAYRGSVQIFLYSSIWAQDFLGRLSHYGLVAIFTFQSGVYLSVFALAVC